METNYKYVRKINKNGNYVWAAYVKVTLADGSLFSRVRYAKTDYEAAKEADAILVSLGIPQANGTILSK